MPISTKLLFSEANWMRHKGATHYNWNNVCAAVQRRTGKKFTDMSVDEFITHFPTQASFLGNKGVSKKSLGITVAIITDTGKQWPRFSRVTLH